MDNFWFGVNYWASHAGTDMWTKWDEAAVRQDFASLKEQGVHVLRVFPNWRDFQPVNACLTASHHLREHRMPDDALPENPYFLSEEMLDRFSVFCRLAKEYGFQLIVGLLTAPSAKIRPTGLGTEGGAFQQALCNSGRIALPLSTPRIRLPLFARFAQKASALQRANSGRPLDGVFLNMLNAPGQSVQHPLLVIPQPAFNLDGIQRMHSPEIAVRQIQVSQECFFQSGFLFPLREYYI